MLGVDRFVATFGSVASGANDTDTLTRVAIGAVRAGFAVVLDRPGSKIPMCTLTTRDMKKADEAAQEASREAGNPRWQQVRHACGLKHAITDDKEARKILTRLTKDDNRVNLGVELGASRMVVVDVDTAEEDAAFMKHWTAEGMPMISKTVASPGVRNDDGEWVHKDGGHYWFEIPDGISLPVGTGAMKVEVEGGGSYSVLWAGRQVLVPPSVRPEGAYSLVGQVNKLPSFISDRIFVEVEAREVRQAARRERMSQLAPGETSPIDEWSAANTWDSILAGDGWEPTGLPDGCSCLIWTAPGSHASPKSATAHDEGCSQYDTSAGHGPLHLWTDNPPAFLSGTGKTVTKIQYLAARDYGDKGATVAVLRDLGIARGEDPEFPSLGASTATSALDSQPAQDLNEPAPELASNGLGSLGKVGDSATPMIESAPVESEELVAARLLMSKMKSSEQLEDLEDPEPLVDGLLDLDTLCRVTGKSNHGKSFVMLDVAASVAMGIPWQGHDVKQGMVVYMVAEGARGWKRRLRAWEARYNNGQYIPSDRLQVLDEPVQTADKNGWFAWRSVLMTLKPVLIIMDTQARITIGTNENDAKEMGIFVEKVEQVRRDTGATVVIVHHLGHTGDQGRGSSAVLGAINTELRVVKDKDVIKVMVEKQKDDVFADPMSFRLVDQDSSAVLEKISDNDPLDNIGMINEHSPGRDRMAAILFHTFNHGEGATRAELRTAMTNHPTLGRMGKSMMYETWNKLIQDQVLDQQLDDNGNLSQRFKLTTKEAERLGLITL